jgi:muramoyltetrapeptide carboxypeptidase
LNRDLSSPKPKRPRLQRGSRVAVVSPASAASAEAVHAGCAHLKSFGYEPVLMPHALVRGPLYYAGTREQRAADLMAAFADSSIDGVLCTRGGWGSAELLPLLDASVVRANAKVFVGYSDHTSLHAWLWNECMLPTFYAPMVAADWSHADGVDHVSWRSAIESNGAWHVGASEGVQVLRAGNRVEGRLLGGCLAILCEALGTPYALHITEPTVLFLEDIHVKPYQWDRMLQHLNFAGCLDHVAGVVFGDMAANVSEQEMPLLESACLHALREFDGPVTLGLRSGHVNRGNVSVPLGAWVALEGGTLKEME